MESVSKYEETRRGSVVVTPLPWPKLIPALGLQLAEAITTEMLFPFVAFMVKDFHLTDDDKKLGYYAGYIVSSFLLAQFVSSFGWGVISDSVGRRPVMMLGLACNALFLVLFGFSKNLFWAVAMRCLNGLMNGNQGVVQAYIREVTDETNQDYAFSFIGVAWGVGQCLGPYLGGSLAQIALKYPNVFSADSLFGEFAYLLPCLVAACFSACLWVYSYFYLEETVTDLPDMPVRTYLRSIFCGRSTRETFTGTEGQPLIGDHPTDTDRHFTAEDLLEKRDRRDSLSLMAAEGIHDYEIEHTHVDTILQTEADTHTNSSTAQRPSTAEPSMTLTQAIFRPQILLILFITFLFGFVQTASNELFPLWSMMPMSSGGLAFTTDQISLCVTTMGIGLLIYTSIFFPTICRHLGVIQMYQLGVLLSAVVMAVVPFFHGIRTHVASDAWFWTLLLSVFVGRAVAMPSCFASLTIMLQNSTTQHVGALSGVFSSVIALSQSLAPILGGSVFAYTSSGGFAFPFDYHFMFLMCGVLCIVGFVTSFKLSQSVTSRAIVN